MTLHYKITDEKGFEYTASGPDGIDKVLVELRPKYGRALIKVKAFPAPTDAESVRRQRIKERYPYPLFAELAINQGWCLKQTLKRWIEAVKSGRKSKT